MPKNLFQFVDSRSFVSNFMDCLKHFRVFLPIFFNDLNALIRVLEVAAYVFRSSGKLIMLVIVMLVISKVLLILNKTNILGHMQSLAKILNIQT